MAERPYSRVYWSVMDDDKFDGIRDDLRLFGAWALLLVVADMAWPAPAFIPPTVPRAAVLRLAKAELVETVGAHRFRVHGLDRERAMRSHQASTAASVRWHTNGSAENMPSRAEPRRAKNQREAIQKPDELLRARSAAGEPR